MAKVKVHVFLKPGVLDVQGKAVEGALNGLGWTGVRDVRVGKLIESEFDGDDAAGEAKKMCDTLLANTVIESYRIEVA
ncbi:MAG: phosphoribosylformylglycinamidine synthase subunit PurS [Alphaproteobacteria bacterium]